MKKNVLTIISIVLVIAMMASLVAVFAGCDSANNEDADLKVGVIWVGDSTEGYTEAHIEGLNKAVENLKAKGYKIAVTTKENIPEDSKCYDTATALAKTCDLIISNSYSHQEFMQKAASENPTKTFIAMTGDFAAICNTPNLKNAFNDVYESRFVSGVVAGLKLDELVKEKKLSDKNYKDGNIKIGYVGAYPYAEVVSGYTAFYLGIKSVVDNVVMDVKYTKSWFDFDKEKETAQAFITDGCVIIGQHADSEGAPTACEQAYNKGTVVYSVGYNVDMLKAAPHAALTSATNDWSVYYTYALTQAVEGKEIVTDWAEGYNQGAVAITKINDSAFTTAPTQKVNETIADIKDGSLKVFNVSKFTVNGESVSTYDAGLSYMNFAVNPPAVVYAWTKPAQVIKTDENGITFFDESNATTFRAAPYFDLRIDGITELN